MIATRGLTTAIFPLTYRTSFFTYSFSNVGLYLKIAYYNITFVRRVGKALSNLDVYNSNFVSKGSSCFTFCLFFATYGLSFLNFFEIALRRNAYRAFSPSYTIAYTISYAYFSNFFGFLSFRTLCRYKKYDYGQLRYLFVTDYMASTNLA